MSKDNEWSEFKSIFSSQNISNGAIFSDFDLKKVTKLTLLEKIVLLFIKRKHFVDKIECSTIVYKIWRGKTYILNQYSNPPQHPMCRCLDDQLRNKTY